MCGTIVGTVVIAAAGLYVYRQEASARRNARAAPQSAAEIDEVG